MLALVLGKPIFAISYHEKFQPLMEGVGLAEFSQNIERIDPDELIVKVNKLRENTSGINLEAKRVTEGYRVALDEQYKRIAGVLCCPTSEKLAIQDNTGDDLTRAI